MLRTRARPGTRGIKAAQTIRSFQQFPCALSLITAAANMGAQWLPWQPRGPLAANPQRRPEPTTEINSWSEQGLLSQVNRHLLVNPARCQLQMAPMTPFDTIIWPIFPKGNPDRNLAPEPTITHSPLGPKLAPGALRVCYAHVQGLELDSLVLSPC